MCNQFACERKQREGVFQDWSPNWPSLTATCWYAAPISASVAPQSPVTAKGLEVLHETEGILHALSSLPAPEQVRVLETRLRASATMYDQLVQENLKALRFFAPANLYIFLHAPVVSCVLQLFPLPVCHTFHGNVKWRLLTHVAPQGQGVCGKRNGSGTRAAQKKSGDAPRRSLGKFACGKSARAYLDAAANVCYLSGIRVCVHGLGRFNWVVCAHITYLHTYVYIYIYIYIHTYTCIYTYLCTYLYIHQHTYIHIHICMYVYMYTQTPTQELIVA